MSNLSAAQFETWSPALKARYFGLTEESIPFRTLLVFSAIAVTFFLLIKSVYVQYPIVFSDEALYTLHSKFLNDPRFVASRPNILYFFVYHIASWFGSNHVFVEKFLNSAFFGLSLFPLYGTARQFLSKSGSYIFSLAIVSSPISSYSVYVMPESLYCFVFWILAYIVVIRLPNDIVYGGIYSGATLALLSAVKPHALILTMTVPLVLLSLFFLNSDNIPVRRLVRAGLVYLLTLVVGRLIINYAITGDLLVSPFGSYYGDLFGPQMQPRRPLVSPELWHTIRGHLSYLAVLFWPAIATAVRPSQLAGRDGRERAHYVALLSFSFAALALLILLAAKYTVDVTAATVPKDACRLIGRYYNVTLGTLVIVFLAGTKFANGNRACSQAFRVVLVTGAIVSGASAYFAFLDYCPNLVDFPEVVCFSMFRIGLALVIAASLAAALGLAFLTPSAGRAIYLTFLGTLSLTTSAAVFVGQVLFIKSPPQVDLAAIAVRNLVPDQIDDGIVLARMEDARSYRAMFQLYSLSERKILAKPVLTADDIPAGRKWALLLDPYVVNVPVYSTLRGKGFVFLQLAPAATAADGALKPAQAH